MRSSYSVIALIYDIKSPIAVLWHCTNNMSQCTSSAGGTGRALCWFQAIVDGKSFCFAHY